MCVRAGIYVYMYVYVRMHEYMHICMHACVCVLFMCVCMTELRDSNIKTQIMLVFNITIRFLLTVKLQ